MCQYSILNIRKLTLICMLLYSGGRSESQSLTKIITVAAIRGDSLCRSLESLLSRSVVKVPKINEKPGQGAAEDTEALSRPVETFTEIIILATNFGHKTFHILVCENVIVERSSNGRQFGNSSPSILRC